MRDATEILINGFAISHYKNIKPDHQFEFIISNKFKLLECVQLFTATPNNASIAIPILNNHEIHNILFELNHVRINPHLNNDSIMDLLFNKLAELGVRINNQPSKDSLQMYFKPLGEIKDNVRFYIKENNNIIFLSNNAKPKLIHSNVSPKF